MMMMISLLDGIITIMMMMISLLILVYFFLLFPLILLHLILFSFSFYFSSIDISTATFAYSVENLSKNQFEIQTPTFTYNFQANTQEAMFQWIEALQVRSHNVWKETLFLAKIIFIKCLLLIAHFCIRSQWHLVSKEINRSPWIPNLIPVKNYGMVNVHVTVW